MDKNLKNKKVLLMGLGVLGGGVATARWLLEQGAALTITDIKNAVFEIIFASLLALGIFTRIASLLLALHMIGIVVSLGYNAVAVRDFGLMIATFTVFLNGPDKLCLKK